MSLESWGAKKEKVIETEAKHLMEDESFGTLREKVKAMTTGERKELVSSLHMLRTRVQKDGVEGLNTLDKLNLYGLTPLACVVGLAAWAIAGPLAGIPALAAAGLNMALGNSGYKKQLMQRIDVLLAAVPQEHVAATNSYSLETRTLNIHEAAPFIDKKSFAEIQESVNKMTPEEKAQFARALHALRKRVEEQGVEGLTGTDTFLYGIATFETVVEIIDIVLHGKESSFGGGSALLPWLLLTDSDKKTKVLSRIDELIKMIEKVDAE